jgi:hypothetical protein
LLIGGGEMPAGRPPDAEDVWVAFKGLPPGERLAVIQRLVEDDDFKKDLLDVALMLQRWAEPSVRLEDYLILI